MRWDGPIGSRVPTLLSYPFRLVRDRFWRACWAGSYEVRNAAEASVWMRWFVAALGVFVIVQRPFPFPASQYASYGVVIGLLIVLNGLIHPRLWSGRPFNWRWVMAQNAMDMVLVTAAVWISGGSPPSFPTCCTTRRWRCSPCCSRR